jgi:hypothetical protein
MTDIKIGDRDRTIPRFSGYKVVRAGRIVKSVTKKYPEIMREAARFERDYERENTVRITRPMLLMDKFASIRDDLKDADFSDKGYIEFPTSPGQVEIVASVFPRIMDVAQDEIATLIALVLAPNSELAEKEEEEAIDEYLQKEGRKILFEADADQVLDLVVKAWALLREQFSQKFEGVGAGNLAALFTTGLDSAREEIETEESNETLPSSSTVSQEPTDGVDEPSSTEPVGAS